MSTSRDRRLSRRGFVGSAAAVAGAPAVASTAASVQASPARIARVTAEAGGIVRIETATLTAVMEKGFLTSLKSKATGEEHIAAFDQKKSDALQLIYRQGEAVDVGEQRFGQVESRQVSDARAEVIFHNWNGDGIITVSADAETGDLIIEPSAYSSRPGVRSCRWLLNGLRPATKLVAPLYQGVSMAIDDTLIRNSHWVWPQGWEAGLAIFQSSGGGFWVHAEDDRYRYKALHIGSAADPFMAAFDTEGYGPMDDNLAAGGLAWRVNVYQGDWKTPAARYRDWLWQAYSLDREQQRRPEWVHQLGMAISWCPGDIAILEAIAKRANPKRVLIHFSNWRTDAYDENYPTYEPSENAMRFLARAQQLGFHVMPHFNSFEVDPNNPVYNSLRDFSYRDIENKRLQGWSWVNRQAIGVPESNASRLSHRSHKVMVKIHPGLSTWRSTLCERIMAAAKKASLKEVFIDVALVTGNLHNCLVENTTSSEGTKKLIRQVGELGGGLQVGAEGLNEIIFQGMSFAQVHLFRSAQQSVNGLDRTGGCPLNDFLFGRLTRQFGYSGLGGRDANEELRARIHEEHGALPTITPRSAAEIDTPASAVKRALENAS
jgi:hypothetical protein